MEIRLLRCGRVEAHLPNGSYCGFAHYEIGGLVKVPSIGFQVKDGKVGSEEYEYMEEREESRGTKNNAFKVGKS